MPAISPKELLDWAIEWDLVQGTWETDWSFPFHKYSPHTNEYEKAWLAAEFAFRSQIDNFVREWLQTLVVPPMSNEQLYWFQLRFRAVVRVLGIIVLDDGTSIFSTGEHTREEVQQWTLITWWAGNGKNEALFEIVEKDFGLQTQRN